MMESIEDISKVVLGEESDVLIVGNADAVKKIISVGSAELFGISKFGVVGIEIVVLLDGLDHVAFSLHLKHLLCDYYMGVMDWHAEMA